MRETGTIVSRVSERAVVQIERGQNCNGCTACKSFGEGKMQIDALNHLDGRVGDVVEVLIEPRQVVKHSLIVFILPLVLMIAGYFVGGELFPDKQETAGIAGSLIGLAFSFVLIRWFDRRAAQSPENDAVIVEIIAKMVH